MRPLAEIFSQGEEIIRGQVLDTNANWLSQQLTQLGFQVKRHTAVGDNLTDLIELLQNIAERADCCICTGGLGPTLDDLTAQAVAAAFGRPLHMDEVALQQIKQYFAHRQRDMADSNRKQAMFPQGASRLDNLWGTAPGFALKQQRCRFFFTPGVPSEMKGMFGEWIKPQLLDQFTLQPDHLLIIRTFGTGESDLQQQVQTVSLPPDVSLGFWTSPDENQVKLCFPAGYDETHMMETGQQVAEHIGDTVFAIDLNAQGQNHLLTVLDEVMSARQLTLAIAESASHGLIATKLMRAPWLQSSLFQSDVSSLIQQFSQAQSDNTENMAAHCAQQLQQQSTCKLALVQLHQDSPQHARVIYNALYTPDGLRCSQRTLAGNPARQQHQAAIAALDLLRRYLQNKCL